MGSDAPEVLKIRGYDVRRRGQRSVPYPGGWWGGMKTGQGARTQRSGLWNHTDGRSAVTVK